MQRPTGAVEEGAGLLEGGGETTDGEEEAISEERTTSVHDCPATISLTGGGQREQLKIRHVHHQQVVAQEINPTDWETHGGEEKDPLARDTANGYGERPLSPAGNEAAISTREAGTGRRVRRLPWHNREGVASVDQKI